MNKPYKSIILYNSSFYSLENMAIEKSAILESDFIEFSPIEAYTSVQTGFLAISAIETYTTLKTKWSKLVKGGFFDNVEYVNTYIFCPGFLTFDTYGTVYQMTNTITLEDFESILKQCPPPKPLVMFCYANKGLFYQSLWYLLPLESQIITFTDEYSDIEIPAGYFFIVVSEVLRGYPNKGIVNFNKKIHDELGDFEPLIYAAPFFDNVAHFSFNTPLLLISVRDSKKNIRLHSVLLDHAEDGNQDYRNIWYWAKRNKELMEGLQAYFNFMTPHSSIQGNPSFERMLKYYNDAYRPLIKKRRAERYYAVRKSFTMSDAFNFSRIKNTLWEQRHYLACFERSFFYLPEHDEKQKAEQVLVLMYLNAIMNNITLGENDQITSPYTNATIKGYLYRKVDKEIAEKKGPK